MLRTIAAVLVCCAAFGAEGTPVTAFLNTYCINCHGAKTQMAERRFDQLRLPVNDGDTLIVLQEMLDKMNLGAMPPKGGKQPGPADRQAFVDALTKMVAEGHAKRLSTGGQTVLRRLNRREYLNTVGDLFGINMTMFDPTTRFPRDQTAGHMDNTGDVLVTSGYLLEQYLDAAEQVVEKAFRQGPRAEPRTWVFHSNFKQQPELDYAHQAVYQQKFLSLYESRNTVRHEGAYGPLYAFAEGVPVDGMYEITVKAEAVNRKHPYDPRIFGMDPEAPFRLGIVPGNAKVGALHHSQPIEPQLGEVTLGDNGPEWHTFRVWLDAGYTPRFIFPNGMIDNRKAFNQILNRYRQLLPEDQRNFTPGIRPARPHVLRYGKMPHIRIHEVRIKGPVETPTAPRLGEPFEEGKTREVLERFASKAYRRPVRPEELDQLLRIVDKRRKDGRTQGEALHDGIKTVLCSPGFLYLSEGVEGKPLPAYALASRLSYFLWSSMPDGELREKAQSGEIGKPAVLIAETRRMLRDGKSKAFVEGFLDSWLNLRALGDMPPDRDMFEQYYAQDLQAAMKTETQLFARRLLEKNESIVNFLDSDFAIVNKPLARLYGIDPGMSSVDAHVFREVKLTNAVRGGLLGQGSVLTVSANGIETSPVTRGVWILENIFGTPPSPPPDNVPPIDPDVRGAKSMREILTKHRESAACMTCHQKIDPPGFALENFDPIGRWRSKYENGVAIDATGELSGGRQFRDVAGMKKLLVENKDQFARMLTERLLTYGCGRRMEKTDRLKVDGIVAELGKRGYGFRDLVELVVTSDIFGKK